MEEKDDGSPPPLAESFDAHPSRVSLRTAPFYFRQRHGKLDWKRLARVNVDEVIRDVDLAMLQELLDEVAFSNVTVEDLPPAGIDNLSVKLIRLSQLTIEYLLHVQECQEGCIRDLVRRLGAATERAQHLEADVLLASKKGKNLKREHAQSQSVLQTCQRLLRQYGMDPSAVIGASFVGPEETAGPPRTQPKHPQYVSALRGYKQSSSPPNSRRHKQQHEQGAPTIPSAFLAPETANPRATVASATARVCGICGKAFSTEEFLKKHVGRRHPGSVALPVPCIGTSPGGGNHQSSSKEKTAAEVETTAGAYEEEKQRREVENEGEAEVAEGARRLGELVRERELARFRSEVEELRKDIEELKRSNNSRDNTAHEVPPAPPAVAPPTKPRLQAPPSKREGVEAGVVASSERGGDRRRRWVRGVIAIRRIVRRLQVNRKATAFAVWRAGDHLYRHDNQLLADNTKVATTPTTAADPPRSGRRLEDLLTAAHRRTDFAARQEREGTETKGPRVAFDRTHAVSLGSEANVRAHFRVDPDQVKEARGQVARELGERTRRLYGVGRAGAGLGREEEHRARMKEVIAAREDAIATRPGLREAYALVAKELQLATKGSTTPRFAEPTATATAAASLASSSRRPSSPRPTSVETPDDPDSEGGRAWRGVSDTFRGHFTSGAGGTGGVDSKALLAMAKRTAEINLEAFKRRQLASEAAKETAAAAHADKPRAAGSSCLQQLLPPTPAIGTPQDRSTFAPSTPTAAAASSNPGGHPRVQVSLRAAKGRSDESAIAPVIIGEDNLRPTLGRNGGGSTDWNGTAFFISKPHLGDGDGSERESPSRPRKRDCSPSAAAVAEEKVDGVFDVIPRVHSGATPHNADWSKSQGGLERGGTTAGDLRISAEARRSRGNDQQKGAGRGGKENGKGNAERGEGVMAASTATATSATITFSTIDSAQIPHPVSGAKQMMHEGRHWTDPTCGQATLGRRAIRDVTATLDERSAGKPEDTRARSGRGNGGERDDKEADALPALTRDRKSAPSPPPKSQAVRLAEEIAREAGRGSGNSSALCARTTAVAETAKKSSSPSITREREGADVSRAAAADPTWGATVDNAGVGGDGLHEAREDKEEELGRRSAPFESDGSESVATAKAAGGGGDGDRFIVYRRATAAARTMVTTTSTATRLLKIADFSSSFSSSSSSSPQSPCCSSDGSEAEPATRQQQQQPVEISSATAVIAVPADEDADPGSDDQEKQKGIGGPVGRGEITGEAAAAELESVSAMFLARGENIRGDFAASTFVGGEDCGGSEEESGEQKRILGGSSGGGGVIAVRECEASIVHDFDDWDDDDDHSISPPNKRLPSSREIRHCSTEARGVVSSAVGKSRQPHLTAVKVDGDAARSDEVSEVEGFSGGMDDEKAEDCCKLQTKIRGFTEANQHGDGSEGSVECAEDKGFKLPSYGSFALGSGLSQFPTRQKNPQEERKKVRSPSKELKPSTPPPVGRLSTEHAWCAGEEKSTTEKNRKITVTAVEDF